MEAKIVTRDYNDAKSSQSKSSSSDYASSTLRERRNWQIHLLYIRQQFPQCLKVIEEQLQACRGTCEYPIYIKGLILRQQGRIQESLTLFQAATCLSLHNTHCFYPLDKHRQALEAHSHHKFHLRPSLPTPTLYNSQPPVLSPHNTQNLKQAGHCLYLLGKHRQALEAATCLSPHNTQNLKQVGHCLYLLGKHRQALEVFDESTKIAPQEDDWGIWHSRGVCQMYLKNYKAAIEALENANAITRHDSTFLQLGKVYQLQQDFKGALEVYREALEFSPENPELLTTMGVICLRLGENQEALDHLSKSLLYDAKDPKTILALGSILQDNEDLDVALIKYRVAAVQTPNSAQLWNNIGMCFFGKTRYIAAVACLKRALYLEPFEWIISYNLGLVHLTTGQYASAFHCFSSSIKSKQDFARSYMYLAIALARLKDFDNACTAYEQALKLDHNDYLAHLNYAITLYLYDEFEKAEDHCQQYEQLLVKIQAEGGEEEEVEEEVIQQYELLRTFLRQKGGGGEEK